LRRKEALQPPDSAQLLNLFGDARFEAAIEFRDLIGALTQFAEQPHILDRDNRLIGKGADQFDLPFGERLHRRLPSVIPCPRDCRAARNPLRTTWQRSRPGCRSTG
jgi:hypothetical protein